MIFMQFAALFVIYAGYLTVMVLLPVAVAAVLGVACVRAIMMRGHPVAANDQVRCPARGPQ